jgi:Rieske Fe-S protein
MGAVKFLVDRDDAPPLSNRERADRWQAEFPYSWDGDDLVGRRQMLRWSVGVAGALFGMTSVLAGLGFARARRRGSAKEIIAADQLAVGEAHYFKYPDDHAILLRLSDDHYVAYNGICTHLSCEVYWDAKERQLICPCHNGQFEPETGEVVAGPPPRPLPRIELEHRNGMIVALHEVDAND